MIRQPELEQLVLKLAQISYDEDNLLIDRMGNPIIYRGNYLYLGYTNVDYVNIERLDIFSNIYHIKMILEMYILFLNVAMNYNIYAYYEDNSDTKFSVCIKIGTLVLKSNFYSNRCLAYINLILIMNNIYISVGDDILCH